MPNTLCCYVILSTHRFLLENIPFIFKVSLKRRYIRFNFISDAALLYLERLHSAPSICRWWKFLDKKIMNSHEQCEVHSKLLDSVKRPFNEYSFLHYSLICWCHFQIATTVAPRTAAVKETYILHHQWWYDVLFHFYFGRKTIKSFNMYSVKKPIYFLPER